MFNEFKNIVKTQKVNTFSIFVTFCSLASLMALMTLFLRHTTRVESNICLQKSVQNFPLCSICRAEKKAKLYRERFLSFTQLFMTNVLGVSRTINTRSFYWFSLLSRQVKATFDAVKNSQLICNPKTAKQVIFKKNQIFVKRIWRALK